MLLLSWECPECPDYSGCSESVLGSFQGNQILLGTFHMPGHLGQHCLLVHLYLWKTKWAYSNLLGQIKQLGQVQDSCYNYDFVLSCFCELGNFRMARSEQHPIIILCFLMLIPSCWPQHWANACTGNNAHDLSTSLLLCLKLSDDCTIQSFGHCSAWCAWLDSACLGSFIWNWAAFISACIWSSSRLCLHLHSSY